MRWMNLTTSNKDMASGNFCLRAATDGGAHMKTHQIRGSKILDQLPVLQGGRYS